MDTLHQHQQQQQDLDQHQQNGPNQPGNSSGQMMINSRQKANFHRDNQSRMNQIMAPSMPNIAHSSFASNISASQSMQNVNMINPYNPLGHSNLMQQQQINVATSHPHIYQQDFQLQSHLMQQQQLNQATLTRGKLNDMNEMLKRRNQRQQEMMPMHSLDGNSQISPIKQLPPTAPKPQNIRQIQMFKEELSPPLPPTATHPLFTPTSGAQNPAMNQNVNTFGSAAQTQPQKQFHGSNPWEREEREKEQQVRREHVRHWRDLQINELSSQPHRTPIQEEQLKALVLERDFERRAQESEEQDDNNSFGKDNMVEVARLSQGGHMPITTSLTTMKQADIKSIVPNTDNSSEISSFPNYPSQHHGNIQPKSILKHNSNRSEEAHASSPSSPSKQAKSTSFAADDRLVTENSISHMTRDLSNLSFNNYDSKDSSDQFDIITPPTQPVRQITPPPPPPERNSSYAVMSQKQQQQSIRSSLGGPGQSMNVLQSSIDPQSHVTPPMQQTKILNYMNTKRNVGGPLSSTSNNNNNNNNNQSTMPVGSVTQMSLSAMMANRDNKRVSFHDDDNNFIETNPMIPEEAELDIIRDSNVSFDLFISSFVAQYLWLSVIRFLAVYPRNHGCNVSDNS